MTETSADLPPSAQAVLDAMKQLATVAEDYGMRMEREFGAYGRKVADAVRALTPPPAPGPYLDNHGQLVEIGRLGVRWADDGGRWVMWDGAQKYGPFTRLLPVSDVAELTARLRWHLLRRHNDDLHGDFDACETCAPDRVLLARFGSLAATATPAEETS